MRLRVAAPLLTATLLFASGAVASDSGGPDVALATAEAPLVLADVARGAQSPPELPAPIDLPSQPIVANEESPVGYLSGHGAVTPTGAFTYEIPLDVPAGINGMQPSLALTYSTAGGDGLLGRGFSLTTSQIRVCGKTIARNRRRDGVALDGSDDFCLDGQPLVALYGQYGADQTEYRTESDIIAKIVSHGSTGTGAPVGFEVTLRNGRRRWYQSAYATRTRSDAQGVTTVTGSEVPVWLLSWERDASDNRIDYQYHVGASPTPPYDTEIYPTDIRYTTSQGQASTRRVQFVYEDQNRPDTRFAYEAGVRWRTSRRLSRIQMYAPNPTQTEMVWQYALNYQSTWDTGESYLVSVIKCGSLGGCLVSKLFEWEGTDPYSPVFTAAPGLWAGRPMRFPTLGDFNGDGRMDILWEEYGPDEFVHAYDQDTILSFDGSDYKLALARADGGFDVYKLNDDLDPDNAFRDVNLYYSRAIDRDGDGKAALLAWRQGGIPSLHDYSYFRWDDAAKKMKWSGTLGSDLKAPSNRPNFVDIDGDGRLDMVSRGATWLVTPYGSESAIDTQIPASSTCKGVAGELDADGRGDVVLCDKVLRQDDAGQFVSVDLGLVEEIDYDWVVPPDNLLFPEGGVYEDTLKLFLVDLNGDGLQDAVYAGRFGDQMFARWNTGNGFGPQFVLGTDGLLEDIGLTAGREVSVVDINQDGLSDLAVTTWNDILHVLVSRGDGTFTKTTVPGINSPDDMQAVVRHFLWGDFDGDGRSDLLVLHGVSASVYLRRSEDLLRLTEVRDGLDAKTARARVTYGRTEGSDPALVKCTFPQRCVRHGLPVVRATSGLESPGTVHYSFEDARTDAQGSGLFAFGKERIYSPAIPSEQVIEYDHATRIDALYPYAQSPRKVTKITPIVEHSSMGAPFVSSATARIESTTYSQKLRYLHGGLSHFVYTSAWSFTVWEEPVTTALGPVAAHYEDVDGPPPGGPLVSRRGAVSLDDYRNATSEQVETAGGTRTTTTRTFTNNEVAWQIGLPVTQTVTSAAVGGAAQTREQSFEHDARGLLEWIHVEPNGSDDVKMSVHLVRDDAGRIRSRVESAPNVAERAIHFEFDDEGVHRRQVWNDLGHSWWTWVHPAYGVVIATMGPNGEQRSATYDDLGRIMHVKELGGLDVHYAYGRYLTPTWPQEFLGTIVVRQDSAGGGSMTTYDELDRPIRSEATSFDGLVAVTETTYDVLGRTIARTRPGFGAPGSGVDEVTWDSLDRVVRRTRPDQTKEEYQHSFFETHHWDQQQNESIVVRDVEGRVKESRSKHASGDVVYGFMKTAFAYAPFDQIETITNSPQNTVTSMSRDVRGRITTSSDPDRGSSQRIYNGLGDLVETVDALSQHTIYHRDELGRAYEVENGDGITSFTWDSAAYGVGKLHATTSPDGVFTTYAYDSMGRRVKKQWDVFGTTVDANGTPQVIQESFAIDWTYDALGRLSQVRYPEVPGRSRFTTVRHYNAQGYLERINEIVGMLPSGPEERALWTALRRDADGALAESEAGNGVRSVWTHDDITGRLQSFEATGANGALDELSYGYDGDGRVTTRNNSISARGEHFSYDSLGRIKTWTLETSGGARATGYVYDSLGNIQVVNLNGQPVESNAYDVVGGRPNQLIHSSVSGDYHYDARGRMYAGGGRTIEYTDFDLPRVVHASGGDTTFTYDAAGGRVKADGPAGATVYIDGVYERRTTPDAHTTHVFFVQGPEGPVAQVVHDGATHQDTRKYYNLDMLGSVVSVTDDGGSVIERMYYEPFGARTDEAGEPLASWSSDVRNGFTFHRHDDDLGLVDMKGRIYDPGLRRFLTPDPRIVDPLFSQSYNPYSYVLDRPLDATDPTGRTAVQVVRQTTCFDGGCVTTTTGVDEAGNTIYMGAQVTYNGAGPNGGGVNQDGAASSLPTPVDDDSQRTPPPPPPPEPPPSPEAPLSDEERDAFDFLQRSGAYFDNGARDGGGAGGAGGGGTSAPPAVGDSGGLGGAPPIQTGDGAGGAPSVRYKENWSSFGFYHTRGMQIPTPVGSLSEFYIEGVSLKGETYDGYRTSACAGTFVGVCESQVVNENAEYTGAYSRSFGASAEIGKFLGISVSVGLIYDPKVRENGPVGKFFGFDWSFLVANGGAGIDVPFEPSNK